MGQSITINDDVYKRLERLAKGFDTPTKVIERLLDYYEQNENIEPIESDQETPAYPTSREVLFYPADENEFKRQLIEAKQAWVLLHKTDGSTTLHEWNAPNFNEFSDLRSNINSGYLRGWKTRRIYKAEFAINKKDLSDM